MCKSYHFSKLNNQSNSFAGWRVTFYYMHLWVKSCASFSCKWIFQVENLLFNEMNNIGILTYTIICKIHWNSIVRALTCRRYRIYRSTSLQTRKWISNDCNSRQVKHLEGCFWEGSWMVSCWCHLIMIFETSKRGRNRGKLIRLDDLTTFGQT